MPFETRAAIVFGCVIAGSVWAFPAAFALFAMFLPTLVGWVVWPG